MYINWKGCKGWQQLAGLQYQDRLREMNLSTLEQRRERGDFTQIYELWNNMDVTDSENLLLREEENTRHTHKDIAKD